LDTCPKISKTLKCNAIDDLLIVEKTEDNVSRIRLKDRTDNSSVLENNIENASITEHSILDSPRNGESYNVEISDSINHVCTQNVLAKENLVDTDVISSNNSSLANSVKTVSEQEGSSNGLDANDEVEPASLDLEDPASTPDILQQLDDDFYDYEQFKDPNEWNDTVCDTKTDVTTTILQTDYLNDNKPNSMDTKHDATEIRQTYTQYSENDTCINDVNDKSIFIHDERTISNFVIPEKLNVHNIDVFGQPDCEFSIQSKYIEMYDVISNDTSNEKSGKALHDFNFTFNNDVRVESNLDTTIHSEDKYFQKSNMKSDANILPNNFCNITDVKSIIQSKESGYIAVETKNQIVQETDMNGVIEEKEANNERMCEQHIPGNDSDAHDLDNSDFTEFMEHKNFDDVSELTNNYDPVSNNSKCGTVQIHDLHAFSSDTTSVQKFSSIEGVSLPCTNTSLDCLKNNVNLTNIANKECATYKSENSLVYFSDGEFYDFDLHDIKSVENRIQENSCSVFEEEEDDDFGDFANFSTTTTEWKSEDIEETKVSGNDDDFGDFSNFETMDVVEQFSLKESISRIENKNVSLGMFI